jgi:hypothetical protein
VVLVPSVGAYVALYKSSGPAAWDAEIRCFTSVTIPPGPEVAFVRFFKDPAAVPADTGGPVPVVNFTLAQFPAVLALIQGGNFVDVDVIGGEFGVGLGIQKVGAVTP